MLINIRTLWICILMFLLSVTLALPVGAQTIKSNALLGSWQRSDGKKTGYILFEPARCILKEGDQKIVFFRSQYEPGKVILNVAAQKIVASTEVKQDTLFLTWPGDNTPRLTFRRLSGTPMEMILRPLALGNGTAKISTLRVKTIREELAARWKRDQSIRAQSVQEGAMETVDAGNAKYLVGLVREVGWIDAKRFGKTASDAAFVLAQHSGDLPLMSAILPIIRRDVTTKQRDGQQYALLYDRLQILSGLKQRYGTQSVSNERGDQVVLALENRLKVDQYRKEIFLPPLSDYLRTFPTANGGKVIFESD